MGLFLVLTGIYTLLTAYIVYFWQKKPSWPYLHLAEKLLLGSALLLQVVWGIQHFLQQNSIAFGMNSILLITVWCMLTYYCFACFFYRLQGLQLILYPLMLVTLLLYHFFPGQPVLYPVDKWLLASHIVISILAYSLFGMCALLAILIWRLSNNLHYRKNSNLICFLPPLLSMEKYMFQLLWIGLLLLTLSLVTGLFFSEHTVGVSLQLTHKLIFGALSWLIFATLLFGQIKYHWRGKQAARLILGGFFFLILTHTGTQFVLEYILHRSWSN